MRPSSRENTALSGPRVGRLSIFALCVLLVTIGDFGIFLVTVPQTRLYESIACYHYYELHDPSRIGPGGGVAEKWCKVAPVQAEVAFVRGYEALFTFIPGTYAHLSCRLLSPCQPD